MIQICSGITRGRVLNAELFTQRFKKLIHLHWPTDCFVKISLHSTECYYSTFYQLYICIIDLVGVLDGYS